MNTKEWAAAFEVGRAFLRLGCVAFGGPAVHLALMEEEFVQRRKWLSSEEFLDLAGAAALIPGPNSTELVIHLGYRRAGNKGLLIAGLSFILPAALITLALAWAYQRYQALPSVGAALYGLKPSILGIVLGAIVRLGKSASQNKAKRGFFTFAYLAAGVAGFVLAHELLVLFGAGMLGAVKAAWRRSRPLQYHRDDRKTDQNDAPNKSPLWPVLASGAGTSIFASKTSLLSLGLYFLKVGSLLYGSGYVLVSILRGELVRGYGWITEQQLLDAVAIGQATPGPVFSTATFIGYLLHGTPGALVATAAIFLPSFVLVRLTSPWVPRMRASAVFGGFLDGVNAGSLGLMTVVLIQLARSALIDVPSYFIGAVGAALALIPRFNPTWVLLLGALLGLAAQPFR